MGQHTRHACTPRAFGGPVCQCVGPLGDDLRSPSEPAPSRTGEVSCTEVAARTAGDDGLLRAHGTCLRCSALDVPEDWLTPNELAARRCPEQCDGDLEWVVERSLWL